MTSKLGYQDGSDSKVGANAAALGGVTACSCLRTEPASRLSPDGFRPTFADSPATWLDQLAGWHVPAHRAVLASVKLGAWLSAALDDPDVCEAMKADIREWFSAGEPMEMLGQALAQARGEQ